jgi:hypothetical protein
VVEYRFLRAYLRGIPAFEEVEADIRTAWLVVLGAAFVVPLRARWLLIAVCVARSGRPQAAS